jgi:chemotaxis family two-component system response regulator Rcp1
MNPRPAAPRKILLIDDNAGDVRLITEAVHAALPAVEVRPVTDSTEALPYLRTALAAAQGPDLVLLDLRMPKKGGLEVLEELKSDPGTAYLPVVILTSSEAAQEVFRAYALHANAVVTKPLGFLQLRSTIKTLCEFWLRVARLPEATYAEYARNQDSAD